MANSLAYTEATSNQNLRTIIEKFQDSFVNRCLTSPALAIGSSSKKAVKNTAVIRYVIEGTPYSKAVSETAFTATTHDVTNAKFRYFTYSINTSGTITCTAGTEAATDAAAWAARAACPSGQVLVGYVLINPTGTGNFDATTTDLDDATVAPGAVYISAPDCGNPDLESL